MYVNERLDVIQGLCEIGISCENNLKDIIYHIEEIKKELNFCSIDYAYEHFSETMNQMTEEEISEINNYKSQDDLISYMQGFAERS